MIKFELERYKYSKDSTIGNLKIIKNGIEIFKCKTLEDTVRPHNIKVKHYTAISEGTYNMVYDYSNSFKQYLLRLEEVINFTGIRIHAGNYIRNTSGCILVGTTEKNFIIYESIKALTEIHKIIKENINKDFSINIKNLSQRE